MCYISFVHADATHCQLHSIRSQAQDCFIWSSITCVGMRHAIF